MKPRNIKIISNKQKSFNFTWKTDGKDPFPVKNGEIGVFFTCKEKIFVWESGIYGNPEIIETYLTTNEEEFLQKILLIDSSFVLYDSEKESVIAVRDTIGNFPLFYHENSQEKSFTFSFSVKNLLDSKLFQPQINPAKIVEYIDFNFEETPNNQTFFKDVYRLLPGHSLKIEQNGNTEKSHLRKLDFQRYESFNDEQYIKEFRQLFIKSVSKSIDPFNKIASTLSGGLDSSSVSCVAQSLKNQPIKTFNFNTETAEGQEDEYIKSVVDKWQIEHRTVRSKYNSFDAIVKLISQNTQPHFSFNHAIQMDLIDEAQNASCEVFLSGHWGDQVVSHGFGYLNELFDAEDWENLKKAIQQYFEFSFFIVESNDINRKKKLETDVKKYILYRFLEKRQREKKWLNLPKMIWILWKHFDFKIKDFSNVIWEKFTRHKIEKVPVIGNIVNPEIRGQCETFKDINFQKLKISELTTTSQKLTQQKHLEGIFRSNSIYGREDMFEIFRQNSIYSAQPFFDAQLIELNQSIPLRLKWGNGKKRNSLRQAMKDFLPEKVANRDTKGEFSNYHRQKMFELVEEFDKRVSDKHQIWEIIDKSVFDKNVELLKSRKYLASETRDNLIAVSRVITLAIWLDYLESRK